MFQPHENKAEHKDDSIQHYGLMGFLLSKQRYRISLPVGSLVGSLYIGRT